MFSLQAWLRKRESIIDDTDRLTVARMVSALNAFEAECGVMIPKRGIDDLGAGA